MTVVEALREGKGGEGKGEGERKREEEFLRALINFAKFTSDANQEERSDRSSSHF